VEVTGLTKTVAEVEISSEATVCVLYDDGTYECF
jgi:hypothetical protein